MPLLPPYFCYFPSLFHATIPARIIKAVGEGSVTLRTYLALLNFKANHRKTLIIDGERGPDGTCQPIPNTSATISM